MDAHNVNHIVLVKPLTTLDDSLKTTKVILGLTEEEEIPQLQMSSMDILLWNCRGAGNDRFKRNLRDIVRFHRPNMIILLETKVELSTMGMYFNQLGFMASTHIDPVGRNGEIWMLWDPSQANVRVIEANSQMITATISRQDYPTWVLSAVYASPNSRMRDELWEGLESIAQNTQEPWLVADDFNDYSSSEEKRSFSVTQNQSQNISQTCRRSKKFAERINDCRTMIFM
ncbi:hypothetical protein LOK49_LG06G01482 [Camellia lanceoleosa]|uniref:Uncharacterized protein n=1 Tax=Camellia lanceoleosa TaxID=1840588 RepID=A0ACC0HH12_9ERIC|nr:hypothetical protein LOK49_LG06G01482 [Camellia lanceoleosa]